MRFLAAFAVILPAICLSAPVCAQESGAGPLLWWRFDPARFADEGGGGAKARAAAEAGLRIASSGGLISDDDTIQLVHALLAASAVGGVRHSLTIHELALSSDAGGAVSLDRISAVLHLETRDRHADLVRTIQTILVDAEPTDEGEAIQRALALPGERKGVAFSREGWSAAREVSWCSHEGGFTVGLGRSSLERWFTEAEALRVAESPFAAHRAALENPSDERFFELYIDLNALRGAVEKVDADDRLTPILAALHLANARQVMLHGTWMDQDGLAMLTFDATWSIRSERPGIVHRRRATVAAWPENLGLPRPPSPPARYAIITEIDPLAIIRQGIDLYAASLDVARQREFATARARWERRHSVAVGRIAQSLEPRVMLSDHPRPVVAVPGATTVFIPVKTGVNRSRLERDIHDVLSGFADVVAWDEQERAWSLYLDEARVLRVATWGLAEISADDDDAPAAGPGRLVLVGGFDLTLGEGAPSALLRANRAWIGGLSEADLTRSKRQGD